MGTLRSYSTSCILTHRLVLLNWLAIRGFHKYADPWSSIPFIWFLGAPFHKAGCIEKSLEYTLCPICRLNVGALIIPGDQVQWQRVELTHCSRFTKNTKVCQIVRWWVLHNKLQCSNKSWTWWQRWYRYTPTFRQLFWLSYQNWSPTTCSWLIDHWIY